MDLRAAAGLATPEEVRVLSEAPIIVGGGLVTVRPMSVDQWVARFGGPQDHLPPPPPDPSRVRDLGDLVSPERSPAFTDDGGPVILADPNREPAPRGKPGFRACRG